MLRRVVPELYLACLLLSVAPAQGSPGEPPLITSSEPFNTLSVEAAKEGRQVRIEGTVVYGDPVWRILWLQDAQGMIYAELPPSGTWPALESGDRVVLEGKTGIVRGGVGLAELTMRTLGPGTLPTPVPMDARAMVDPGRPATYARVRGVIRIVSVEDPLRLRVVVDDRPFDCWVRHHTAAELEGLLDARVSIDGLCAHAYDAQGQVSGAVLYIPSLRNIRVEERGPADPFQQPVTPIRFLFSQPASSRRQPARLHIQGIVVHQLAGESLAVSDGTDSIRCLSPQNSALDKGQRVDVVGFPLLSEGGRYLAHAVFRPVGSSDAAAPAVPAPVATNATLPILDQVGKIRRLKPDEARLGYPVRIEGVVTFHDAAWQNLFISDASGGVYVAPGPLDRTLRPGTRVVVAGATDPGGYAPMVVRSQITVLSEGEPPPPTPITFAQGRTGTHDCDWVQIEGTVFSSEIENEHLFFSVFAGDGSFRCCLPRANDLSLATNLVACTVRLQGVCTVSLNKAKLFSGLGLNVPDATRIEIVERPPGGPFGLPARPIGEVLRSLPAQLGTVFLKVRGVVTLSRPSLGFYVQDASGSIYVDSHQTNRLAIGDEVEAVGIQGSGEYAPFIQEGLFRVVGHRDEPAPRTLAAEKILEGQDHAELVRLEARLLEDVMPSVAPELVLQAGPIAFIASVETLGESPKTGSLRAGSVLQLTGVCVIKANELRQPKSFRLLLRSPRDILVRQQPPFLSLRRVLALAACAGIAAVVALTWVAALRRRVRLQTGQIRVRIEREAALEARYRHLIEQSPAAIIITDANGVIESVNAKFTDITGYSRESVIGKNPRLLKSGDRSKEEYARMWQDLKAGREWQGQFLNRKLNGDEYLVSSLIAPIRNEGGAITHFIAIQEDVTDRRRLEMELRHAQKMESVGQLAAGVAHDFNNLLTVIQGHVGLLREQAGVDPYIAESAAEIAAAAQRAAELTRQLLAFGRKQLIQAVVLDLNQVLARVSKMLERLLGEHILLTVNCEPGLPTIRADPGLLEQVIVNLAVNARDAMPQGGHLTLRTGHLVLNRTQASQHSDAQAGPYVTLQVADDGTGMDAATLSRLFEPFFTTKAVGKGTGLGLATAYGIIQQHRGWITVASEKGWGTTFVVHLPVDGSPLPPSDAPTPTTPRHGASHTVLVVEDEDSLRRLTCRILERHGYRTLQAASGKEALSVWADHSDAVDLLLTDLVMPGGVSGGELARQLRDQKPSLPVIYSSGYSEELTDASLHLDTELNFLPKPYGPDVLTAMVEQALGRRCPEPR